MTDAYRVVKTFIVEADDADQALALVGEPVSTTVVLTDLPTDRHAHRKWYEQRITTLDGAWDDYMDRTISAELAEYPVLPRVPSLGELKIPTTVLSMLFDLAISAYRRRAEGDTASGITDPQD